MKKSILKGFEVQFIMIFFSFMIFATNEFTLEHAWVNVIASVLLLFVYLMLIYTDSFNCARESLSLGEKPPLTFVSIMIVYIIPLAIMLWAAIAPLEYNQAYMIEPGDLENGIPAVYDYTVAVRQNAWFELCMFPYKGVYEMLGGGTLVHLLSFLPGIAVSFLGYRNAKRGIDLMARANSFLQKLIYKKKDN